MTSQSTGLNYLLITRRLWLRESWRPPNKKTFEYFCGRMTLFKSIGVETISRSLVCSLARSYAHSSHNDMKLRDHPWLSYKTARSWPPIWIWRSGNKYTRATGEVGTLKDVLLSKVEPCRFFFLVMEHGGQEYEGILLFQDATICRQV
jgi:hypothetical protein